MVEQVLTVQRLRDRNRQLVEERKQLRAEKRRLETEARRNKAKSRKVAAQLESEKNRIAAQLESERALWSSEATDRRLTHGDARLMHRLEVLDDILGSEDSLRAITGMSMERFGTLTAEFRRGDRPAEGHPAVQGRPAAS